MNRLENNNESVLKMAYEELCQKFDPENGGFKSYPKFPKPHNLFFLLRYWNRTGNENCLKNVEQTLQKMRNGGIYDHLGFGFYRYSRDPKWLFPHFEKTLYDQAMISMAYIEAYQVTKNEEYKKTVTEIFEYVLNVLSANEKGFYSEENINYEEKIKEFYLWTYKEIKQILKEEADLIIKVFNIEESGNFQEEHSRINTGKNILYLTKSLAELSQELNIPQKELKNRIEMARKRLLKVREKRAQPYKDKKISTDWNGLMIAALARGATVLGNSKYLDAARSATDFIFKNMYKSDELLLHKYQDEHAQRKAYLSDYAFLIWGLIELYEATFDIYYLQKALELNNELLKYFWDDKNGGFYCIPINNKEVLVRKKEIYDGVIPSGNSISMLNLLRLGHITQNPDFKQKAHLIKNFFFSNINNQLISDYIQLMSVIDFELGPVYEVVINGNSEKRDTKKMIKAIHKEFIPNKVLILRKTEQKNIDIDSITKFTQNLKNIYEKATACIYLNHESMLITRNTDEILNFCKKTIPFIL